MAGPSLHPLAHLRDGGRWTRTAIIALLLDHPSSRSSLARRLGLTPQAVSAQVKEAIAAGLVRDDGDGLRATADGVQQVRDDSDRLAAALEAMRGPLASVETVSAVAAAPVGPGDRVGLWMRRGDLVADPAKVGASRGRALHAAHPGAEVLVTGLEGVVDLTPGTVTLVRVPGPAEGGIQRIDEAALARVLPAADRFGAVGTGAAVLARVRGRLDFEFGAAQAAGNAAQRGLDVLLYVSSDRFREALQALEDAATSVQVIEAPVRSAPGASPDAGDAMA